MPSDFGKAFRAARAAGKKEFNWSGKSYHTKLREEVEAETAAKAKPAAKSKPKTLADVLAKDKKLDAAIGKSPQALASKAKAGGWSGPTKPKPKPKAEAPKVAAKPGDSIGQKALNCMAKGGMVKRGCGYKK